MTDFPSIPESLQPKMEMVWRAARCVCDNILDFHPDVIVALMHSGWGMAFAGKVLWDHTQAGPFPPIARVNLGREKITVFTEMHNLEEVCFAGIYTSGYVVGKLLAWLYTHLDWRMQLRGHVSAALPAGIDPQRILVVDDCIHEGSTAMVALSLLERVYPLAQLRYLDTHGWYRSDYQKFMLSAFDFCREAFPETSALSRELINSLDTVAVGSEDVSMDSLDWRPVTVDSPDVQALRDYAPPEQWVQVAPQIYAAIARYIGGRAADYTPAAPEVNSIKFQLAAEWLIMRDIWLENGLTRRQVQQRYGFTEQQVVTFLRRHIEYDELAVAGYGRGARYVIPPGLRLKVETPQADDSEDDPLEAYCLLPGRLFFGEHLGYYEAAETHAYSRNLVRKVLALGVDCWLDVQVWARGGVIEDNPYVSS